MQHVVVERHRIGTRRLIGDRHREQQATRTRCRQGIARDIVGHQFGANRRGRQMQAGCKREAVGARAISADAAAQRAREDRFTCIAVPSQIGIEVIYRARRIAARQTIIVNRRRRCASRREVCIHNRETHIGCRRVTITIGYRKGGRHKAGGCRVFCRERVVPVCLHLDRARANVDGLRVVGIQRIEHQRSAANMRHRCPIGARREVKRARHCRTLIDILGRFRRRRRRIVIDIDRYGGRRGRRCSIRDGERENIRFDDGWHIGGWAGEFVCVCGNACRYVIRGHGQGAVSAGKRRGAKDEGRYRSGRAIDRHTLKIVEPIRV